MRYPVSLQPGGMLGFLAPSFGCATEPYYSAFKNALKILEKKGFSEKLGPNCFEGSGIGISNTPEACGEEVNAFFADPDCGALISCGGGELMCGILDHVDFDAIKKAPAKWFMGFSDNTNLTFLLPTLCDTAAVYGPCAATFGMEPWHPVLDDALGILMGTRRKASLYGSWEKEGLKDKDHPLLPYNITEKTVLVKSKDTPDSVTFSGRMLGGCLDVLNALGGTCYDKVADFKQHYADDGVVWFLESCDLNVLDMRRALWHLDHCGWFEGAKGFIIGRPYHFGEDIMGLDQYSAVTGILGKYKVPIIMDADLGHLPPSMPMIVGAKGEVSCSGNALEIIFTE